ncbi:3'-phosphoadenosine 5'-phosphosulfate sulfotransferase [Teratosphaeriaceae sp. CCFEE 6253]|nr:3'-phosphoadenosine 5'-phosphosulfate sulfotransferase [Teratosphaeriaceae sp. CCFEE 6253]
MPHPVLGVSSDSHSHGIGNGDAATIAPGALPELCAGIHERVDAFLKSEPATERLRRVQEQSRLSLKVLEEALERYSLDELSLSYNGGKDCLVLLILYLSALHSHASKTSAPHSSNGASHPPPPPQPKQLRSVYIISPHPFTEIDDFVDSSLRTYHLALARYAKPMKEAFAAYLHDTPSVRAIFVGTRRTDPHGATLAYFDPTDRGWPAFMRIHPVIDWHYAEIWAFLRALGVPYCELYDKGYTSLGGTTDTFPNPALKRDDPGGGKEAGFRPAYELVEDDEERLGRDR